MMTAISSTIAVRAVPTAAYNQVALSGTSVVSLCGGSVEMCVGLRAAGNVCSGYTRTLVGRMVR